MCCSSAAKASNQLCAPWFTTFELVLLDLELARFHILEKTLLHHNMHSGVLGIQVRTQFSFIVSGPIAIQDDIVQR
jgi:hypothetical protein